MWRLDVEATRRAGETRHKVPSYSAASAGCTRPTAAVGPGLCGSGLDRDGLFTATPMPLAFRLGRESLEGAR